MIFSNAQAQRAPNMNIYAANIARAPAAPQKPLTLNSPMVNRVHAAKPGCSACGKKVA